MQMFGQDAMSALLQVMMHYQWYVQAPIKPRNSQCESYKAQRVPLKV